MAAKKVDGLVEAVRYAPDGGVQLVRAYMRRGATFSDHVLIGRDDFIARLKAGKRFYTGARRPLLASEFEVGKPIRLEKADGQTVIISGGGQNGQDHIEGVPRF